MGIQEKDLPEKPNVLWGVMPLLHRFPTRIRALLRGTEHTTFVFHSPAYTNRNQKSMRHSNNYIKYIYTYCKVYSFAFFFTRCFF